MAFLFLSIPFARPHELTACQFWGLYFTLMSVGFTFVISLSGFKKNKNVLIMQLKFPDSCQTKNVKCCGKCQCNFGSNNFTFFFNATKTRGELSRIDSHRGNECHTNESPHYKSLRWILTKKLSTEVTSNKSFV